jgi:hypothetical protein
LDFSVLEFTYYISGDTSDLDTQQRKSEEGNGDKGNQWNQREKGNFNGKGLIFGNQWSGMVSSVWGVSCKSTGTWRSRKKEREKKE